MKEHRLDFAAGLLGGIIIADDLSPWLWILVAALLAAPAFVRGWRRAGLKTGGE